MTIAPAGFPKAAAGFVFGSSPGEAKEICESGGNRWSESGEDASCSGVGPGIDLEAHVDLTFPNNALSGALLYIAVGADSSTWLGRFREIERTIESKYGEPFTRLLQQPPDCKDQIDKCLQEGRA